MTPPPASLGPLGAGGPGAPGGLGGLPGPEGPGDLICSARACGAPATRAVLWRNPRLHTEDRTKVWLACGDHEEPLRAHLALRAFPVRTCALADIPEGAG